MLYSIESLAAYISNPWEVKVSQLQINNLTQDSRQVQEGTLFIAMRGSQVDGHNYIPQALERGASLVVAESAYQQSLEEAGLATCPVVFVPDTAAFISLLAADFYGQPSHHLDVYGITGTNGKTSIAYILQSYLQQLGQSTGMIGTVAAGVDGKALATALNTTPEPIQLQGLFKQMVDAQAQSVVMEVSSIGIDQGRVGAVDFSVGIFTNLSQDHLDYHLTMEAYQASKVQFFQSLAPHNQRGQENIAVINADDPQAGQFIQASSHLKMVLYGQASHADYHFDHFHFQAPYSCFDLTYRGKTYRVQTPLVGEFNVYNVTAAIAALHQKGYDLNDILAVAPHIQTIPGRMEAVIFSDEQDIQVYVDFAHTPSAIYQALQAGRQVCSSELYAVFGCGGDRDKTKRPLMTQAAAAWADHLILTSDNPRTEDQDDIFADMVDQVDVPASTPTIKDRAQAIHWAISQAQAGDTVIICGKGHEKEQIIGHDAIPFSDQQEALKALEDKYS